MAGHTGLLSVTCSRIAFELSMNDLVSVAVGRPVDAADKCASLRMLSLTVLLRLLGTALAGLPTNPVTS